MAVELKGRPLVPGRASGRAVLTEYISFYGDVDVERAELRDGRSLKGAVLLARAGRGSTVGSYVIYALAKRHGAPSAVVMEKAEPIIVTGCVLAGIPLVDGIPWSALSRVREGSRVTVLPDGRVIVEEQRAG
ncbi:aconitase X swivel domain-containing protein [Stetteria hydrogenophila]